MKIGRRDFMKASAVAAGALALACCCALLAEEAIGPCIRDDALEAAFFGEERGFDLHSIMRREPEVSFAEWNADPDYGKLFEITLRANNGRGEPLRSAQLPKGYTSPPTDALTLDNHSPCRQRISNASRDDDKTNLILQWQGFDLGEETAAVDVAVTLTASESKPGIEWRIRVSNRSKKYGVWLAAFPYIRLKPIGDSAANDCVAYPKGLGRLIPNPFDEGNRKNYKFCHSAKAGEQIILTHPRPLNMQWGAFYDEELGGLYLATHDPTAHRKDFCYTSRDGALWFHLLHYPENMGQPGNGYESPYPFVTQFTPGNWYDAAQIYRAWALNQVWAGKGPLAQREDIPRWFRDMPLYFVVYSKGDSVESATESTLRYKEFLGYDGPITVNWYQWMEYIPEATCTGRESAVSRAGNPFPAKKGFKEAVARLKEKGIYVRPYVDVRVFDVPGGIHKIPPDWLPYTSKDVNGIPCLWSREWPGLVDMCMTTEFYQSYVAETCARLAREYGAKGAYLDQFAGNSSPCFDPSHGHPLGGGDWQFHAVRQIALKTREACRAIDPDCTFGGENGADAFIDVLDTNLYHYDIWPGIVPIAPAVYSGYWICTGRGIHTCMNNDTAFRMALGNIFTHGTKLGRFCTNNDRWLREPQYSKNMELLKKLVQYRVAARDYLQYGRMLRPLRFENNVPDVAYSSDNKRVETVPYGCVIRQPAVMSSVWEAPDGSMAVVLFNISGEAQEIRFKLTSEDYPIVKPKAKLSQLMADGSTMLLGELGGDVVERTDRLDADEVRILIVQ